MKCKECNSTLGASCLRLKSKAGNFEVFCSFECLIAYSTKQILEAWHGRRSKLLLLIHNKPRAGRPRTRPRTESN